MRNRKVNVMIPLEFTCSSLIKKSTFYIDMAFNVKQNIDLKLTPSTWFIYLISCEFRSTLTYLLQEWEFKVKSMHWIQFSRIWLNTIAMSCFYLVCSDLFLHRCYLSVWKISHMGVRFSVRGIFSCLFDQLWEWE